jgi:ribonuclease R
VIQESEEIKKEASKNTVYYYRSLKNKEFEAGKFFQKAFADEQITEKQIFPTKKSEVFQGSGRTDFRDWYTLTIDGSDAKDLDDAISIRQETNGDYTLAVHIADVAEYVTEGSVLDREALARATSIYTPGKVIPMLPEILSNDLCSLHPGEPKLVLSAVMTIDPKGYVKHTDIVEGIIESQHRGVYDAIMNYQL